MELAMDYDELDHFTLLANKRASCSDPICYKEVSGTGMCVAAAGTESTQAAVSTAAAIPLWMRLSLMEERRSRVERALATIYSANFVKIEAYSIRG
jgi:hypothetical protein